MIKPIESRGFSEEHQELIVGDTRAGMRLDKYIAEELSSHSRSEIQSWIDDGRVTIDGERPKASYRVMPGQTIAVRIPPPANRELRPEPLPLSIVYEDQDVLVIDKPAGMVVHPAHGHWTGTLANALLHHRPEIASTASGHRPGIVHRLDMDTSGVMIVAKHESARRHLQAQFKARSVVKEYLALVEGHLGAQEGQIQAAIGRDPRRRKRMAVLPMGRGGRSALTLFHLLHQYDSFALIVAKPRTGRTHQIRVHFAYIGHPLVGDTIYGRRKPALDCPRQFLHAQKLVLRLPSSEIPREFTAPLPEDLQKVLDELGKIPPL